MYLFTYGLLTNPLYMKNCVPVCSGTLLDHCLEFNLYANISESQGKSVNGVLWSIDEHELQKTDITEGYPNFYDRKLVAIETNDALYTAYVYFMTEESRIDRFGIHPSDDYIETIINGYSHFSINNDQIYNALNIGGFTQN